MRLDEWKEVKLGEIVDSVSIKPSPHSEKVVLINTSDVIDGKVLNHKYVDNKNLRGQFKKSFQKGDILFSEIRPRNRRFAYVDFDSKNYIASTKLMVLRAKDNVDHEFLYNILSSKEIIAILQSLAESRSGTFPQITYRELSNLRVKIPPIDEQKCIATYILLIDKLKLNYAKINQNLEAMAQAIFKHWFVDFEFPDEEGKPYKSSGGEMVESEFGLIPKGWSIQAINEISTLYAGGDKPKVVSKFRTPMNPVPIFSNGINNNGLYGYTKKAKILEESVTVSARGTIGFVCLRAEPYVPIVRLISVVPKPELLSAKYLYQWLSCIHIKGTGTTQQQLTVPAFKKTKIIIPTIDIMQKYSSTVIPFYDQISKNNCGSNLLKQIRNTLLPKLMSGEIRVPMEVAEQKN